MHSTLRKLTGELLVAFPCGSRGVHLHHTCVHPSYLTSCLPLFRATNHRPTDSNRPSFLSFFPSFFFFSFVGLAQTRSPLRNSPHFSLSPHASYLVSITSFATHPRRYIGPGDNGEGQTPDTTNFVGGEWIVRHLFSPSYLFILSRMDGIFSDIFNYVFLCAYRTTRIKIISIKIKTHLDRTNF